MNKYVLKCGATFVLVVLLTYSLGYTWGISTTNDPIGVLLSLSAQWLMCYTMVVCVWLVWSDELIEVIDHLTDWYIKKTR